MKNLFLSALLVLTVSFTFANNGLDKKFDFNSNIENINAKPSKESATIVLNVKKLSTIENYKLDFNSIEDFRNFDVNQINFFPPGDPVVTATITVSVTVGSSLVGGEVTVTVSVKVTGTIKEIKAKIKELKKGSLEAIKEIKK